MQYLGLDSYPSSLVRVRSPQYAILGQTVQLYCNFTLPPGNNNFYSLKVGLEKYFISIVLVGLDKTSISHYFPLTKLSSFNLL